MQAMPGRRALLSTSNCTHMISVVRRAPLSGRRQASLTAVTTSTLPEGEDNVSGCQCLVFVLGPNMSVYTSVTGPIADNDEVGRFRDYLRIQSVQPSPDYESIGKFLKGIAAELNLPFTMHECVAGKPIFVITYPGIEPGQKSILLNSHTDVVPVYPEMWKYPPFSAHMDEAGNIYARGSQDMKCVGMWYLEAVRRFVKEGRSFKRTLHLTFVPDEEIGSEDGMKAFVQTDVFRKLNVGFGLDEGVASESDVYNVYYGERNGWWIQFKCKGNPGHGSKFIEGTAMEKAHKLIDLVLKFRDQQEKRLKGDPRLTLGDVISVNVNMLSGGVETNVVPAEIMVGVDMRIPPSENFETIERMIEDWARKAGEGVSHEFGYKGCFSDVTSTGKDNPYWVAFEAVLNKRGLKFSKQIFIGGTDCRFVRPLGVPAIGFSPMINTPQLLHDHNEFLNKDVYLRGIDIYTDIIDAVANC